MKVTAPGSLAFLPGHAVLMAAWAFELAPGEYYAGDHTKAGRRKCLLAALAHIATESGVDLEPESVHPASDRILKTWRRQEHESQRAAADAIALAKDKARAP